MQLKAYQMSAVVFLELASIVADGKVHLRAHQTVHLGKYQTIESSLTPLTAFSASFVHASSERLETGVVMETVTSIVLDQAFADHGQKLQWV